MNAFSPKKEKNYECFFNTKKILMFKLKISRYFTLTHSYRFFLWTKDMVKSFSFEWNPNCYIFFTTKKRRRRESLFYFFYKQNQDCL